MTDTKSDPPKFFGGGDQSPANESDKLRNGPRPSESQALFEVVKVLEQLDDNELRARVLEGVAAFFRIAAGPSSSSQASFRVPTEVTSGGFSEDRTISPKEFLLQKQPRSEVERVACLAYYLTHYRETPHFKTFDISKLNTDAAQPKFSNASQAVENATKTNYLVPATKGSKQLSGPGELFVQMMPDRDAARAAMQTAMPRRRRRVFLSNSDDNVEENRGNE